jgi:hypothetical protein
MTPPLFQPIMGWSFRRGFGAGPFRMNLSTKGVGFSVGVKGFRTGIRSNGRRYSRVTIPGTGLAYSTTHASKGCLVIIAVFIPGTVAVVRALV